MKKIIGTKYQTYIEDDLHILRLINILKDDESEEEKYIMVDGKQRVKMNKNEFETLIELEPDALLNIFISNTNEVGEDVYACINRTEDLKQGVSAPSLVLRQCIYSMSKNSFNSMNDIFVGECMNYINAPSEDVFKSLLEFDEIIYTTSIAVYVDDTLNEIFQYIPHDELKKFDGALCKIKKEIESPMVKGYCSTLKELFIDNNFILNYRSLFGITQVDFPIELDNNTSEDGVVTLNNKQIKRIEDLLRVYITDVNVLKYDKDIDVSEIVSHSHIMLSDKNGKIYLITYTVTGNYPIDMEIPNAMRIS